MVLPRWLLLLLLLTSAVLVRPALDRARGGEPVVVAVEVVPDGSVAVPGLAAAAADELALVDAWFGSQHPNADGLRWRRDDAGRIAVATLPDAGPADRLLTPADVGRRVRAAGLAGPDDVVLALVDLVVPGACGQAGGDGRGRVTAVVWMATCDDRPSPATTGLPDGATFVVAHELAHAMGATPTCAPNASLLGHVIDDRDDLMYVGRGRYRAPEPVLDVGNDDYFLAFVPGCEDISGSPLWRR